MSSVRPGVLPPALLPTRELRGHRAHLSRIILLAFLPPRTGLRLLGAGRSLLTIAPKPAHSRASVSLVVGADLSWPFLL